MVGRDSIGEQRSQEVPDSGLMAGFHDVKGGTGVVLESFTSVLNSSISRIVAEQSPPWKPTKLDVASKGRFSDLRGRSQTVSGRGRGDKILPRETKIFPQESP